MRISQPPAELTVSDLDLIAALEHHFGHELPAGVGIADLVKIDVTENRILGSQRPMVCGAFTFTLKQRSNPQ